MTPLAPAAVDPRLAAFCDPNSADVFHSVVHLNNVWKPGPFDVEAIHADARDAFVRLFMRASTPPYPDFGKTQLVLGAGGSGKTHLMRAFRDLAHNRGAHCGYLQMISYAEDYTRYVLSNLIDALNQPYLDQIHPAPGLAKLARGVLDSIEGLSEEAKQRIGEEPRELAVTVREMGRLADRAIRSGRFDDRDLYLLRALLYLLPNDRQLKARVMLWLRCQDLSDSDRALLGDLVPRTQDGAALEMICGLGRIMTAVDQGPLVLLADQLEETFDHTLDEKDSGRRFRHAVDSLVNIASAVPTAVVVVACLETHYEAVRQRLPGPKLDRLERDPEPLRLRNSRDLNEVEAILERRLQHLYEAHGVEPSQREPLYPFCRAQLKPLAGKTTRDVLEFFRRHQQRCIEARAWVPPEAEESGSPPTAPPDGNLAQAWNDFRAAFQSPGLDDENVLADLLAWGIGAATAEMPPGLHFGKPTAEGRFIDLEIHLHDAAVDKLLVAVCDRGSQGGGLGRQIEEVVQRAGELPAVVVRSTAFPSAPGTAVSKRLAGLIEPKGRWRRSVVENGDWRALAAFRSFQAKHAASPSFTAWQQSSRPLSELPALRSILALDRLLAGLTVPAPASVAPPPPAAGPEVVPPVAVPAVASGPLVLGVSRGALAAPVTITPQELTQHAAFLGGPGSGKTTAALNLVEQLLATGVPAVLIDRKGDLSRYADPEAWQAPEPDAARAARRQQLRDRIDVALFTPGNANGRPLTLPVVPADLAHLPEDERQQLAGYAAAALSGMMGNKARGPDPKLAILGKAIEVLAGVPGRTVTAQTLRQLVAERDDSLLLAVGGEYEDRHYKKLAEDLLTLCLRCERLLDGGPGEALDVDALLGRGPHARPGKTRLSIVNTQALDEPTAEFWLAQLLTALNRWRSRNPSDRLQAVFLFDEADKYLPAISQPATKAPLESLLRRARSAGIGLFLATQSPGDLDYKCRDQVRAWMIGRVKETVAINKLRPLLEVGKIDAVARLPGQQTGEFYLAREREVTPVLADACLIPTAQVPEERIAELARTTRPAGAK